MIFTESLLIYVFSSLFMISINNSSDNFNENILRLVFAFVAFVGSVATCGCLAGVGWHVRILSNFFLEVFCLKIIFSLTKY